MIYYSFVRSGIILRSETKGLVMRNVFKAVGRPRGGVRVAHNKLTARLETERIEPPELVVLPMLQHIGAPGVPVVKPGDHVKIGQVVGEAAPGLSVPVHATVSGVVKAVGDVMTADGRKGAAVTIESDGLNELYEGIAPPQVNDKEQLIAAVKASGLVGLGGAGFPAYAKLAVKPEQKVDTLVVNAAECEPYITTDHRECVENSYDIRSGVQIISDLLGIERVVIAVEDNKPEAIDILSRVAEYDDESDRIKVMTLPSRYPQGAEKMMALSATGRRIPAGKLPADVGCIVMNVASVAFVARYVKTGKPLVSRTVTVSGDAVRTPKNLRVPIGTKISALIDACGGFRVEPEEIILGGPMMGSDIFDIDVPILKKNNAVLAFERSTGAFKKQTDCISCGKCHEVCPMSLVPTRLMRDAIKHDADALAKHYVSLCMECGCCAYGCPAGIPLVQYIRDGKRQVREAAKK